MNKNKKFAAGISIILIAIVYLAVTGFNQDFSYYLTADELLAQGNQAYGKKIKVAGIVTVGSIDKSKNPMTFTITQNDAVLKVKYTGFNPVPDTFKDRSQVVADGVLGEDGVFIADHIQAKCASKYESKLTGEQETSKY